MFLFIFSWAFLAFVSFLGGLWIAKGWRSGGLTLASLPVSYGIFLLVRSAIYFWGTLLLFWITGVHMYLAPAQCVWTISCVVTFVLVVSFYRLQPSFNARIFIEWRIQGALYCFALLVILIAMGIMLLLFFEAASFFQHVSIVDFIFGLKWTPYVSPKGECLYFGAVPLILGTCLITSIAILIAFPFGLLSAIYFSEYANYRVRRFLKPFLEMLAGVPTVVYGFFAAVEVAPFVSWVGQFLGLRVASESALAAGLVMGLMILPFVLSLCDDALRGVPRELREGAWALGATSSEAICQVLLPAAFPGIMAAFLLGISRAIGETMLVAMASGMSAHLTVNPLQAVTTVTVQIVALLTGDQEPDSPKTHAAFALGLLLFGVTLVFNWIALRIVRKTRKGLAIS